MRGDQPVGHVVRVAGRVADAFEPVLLRQLTDQPVEADRPAPLVRAVPRVDVLAEQRDLARPARDQRPRLGNQIGERSEERRVGKECVSTCRSRWSPDNYKTQSMTYKSQVYYYTEQTHVLL